jgi:hypothetical protein
MAIAIRKTKTTIHCQRLPRELLTMALPVSVKCLANARLMAETTKKISSGTAPIQRGAWLNEELFGVGDSGKVLK